MKKTIKLIVVALVLCLLFATVVSCKANNKPVMSIDGKTLSLNTYEFLLSRMKGTLYYYGFDVTSDSFWKTIISADGMTYDDYFSTSVLEQASRYVIADYLFDENGQSFTEEDEETVDKLMNTLVEAAGSKTALNGELQTFGYNYGMLRELYTLELKVKLLKAHLYGESGEKIETSVKEEYFNESYVAFGQIFLASYYYVIDTDSFGDNVYYTDENHTAIAYDTVNGTPQNDEFGKPMTDIFGNTAYFNGEGRVAYDKVNGVLGYLTDDDGNKVTENYDEEMLAEMFDRAHAYAEACNGDIDKFLEYASIYDESESGGSITYLYCSPDYYGSQSAAAAYLDDIAEGLTNMETGECRAAQSDYGFHVFCRFENEAGAYDDEAYADSFSDFYGNLINKLFDEECAKHEDLVEIDHDNLEAAPTMAEVGVNILY